VAVAEQAVQFAEQSEQVPSPSLTTPIVLPLGVQVVQASAAVHASQAVPQAEQALGDPVS
jgi:hypothetical protein